MSTTLTNGLKLPDKGSVDWYADMQSNYAILDSAVGTIAEHSTQIAGKAPLVHTHTKSDITDFPAYGNTAGTICEGNDSRLSDARTPVAHTHLTSDVTDLLNTAHEWSKSQTYSDGSAIIIKDYGAEIGNEPSAYNEQRIRFDDKNNNYIAAIKYQNQLSSANHISNGLEFSITNKFKDGVKDATGTAITNVFRVELWNNGTKSVYNEGRWRSNLLPFGNNTNDVGSSSYQWNNLYAKNYYYNGVAWGLDKANTWTQDQTIASGSNDKCYYVKDTVYELGQTYSNGEHLGGLTICDKNNDVVGLLDIVDRSYGHTEMRIRVQQKFDPNSNNRSTSGTILNNEITLGIASDKTNYIGFNADLWGANHNLGTATYKWKTLNGINPGALSLPSKSFESINAQIYNPSDQLNAIDLNGGANYWISDCDCYIYFFTKNDRFSWIQIYWPDASVCLGQTYTPVPNETSDYSGFIPVAANTKVIIKIKGTQAPAFRRVPCQGNV